VPLPNCALHDNVQHGSIFFREHSMLIRLVRLLRATGHELAILWFACRSPATPRGVKLAALMMVLYVLSPFDILPDWMPLLGWADDVTLLALAVPALLRLVPPQVLIEARTRAARWNVRKPWSLG
jgi:uncharacterized membrane protein YkvA (DUF1232 family)